MSKLKLLTVAVVGLLLLNLGLLLFMALHRPGPGRRGGGPPPDRRGPRNLVIRKLNFDQAQTAAYEQLIESHKKNARKLDEEIRSTRAQFYGTLAEPSATDEDSLLRRLGTLQTEIERIHYQHFAEVKKLCRPEQEEDFRELSRELVGYFGPPPPRR